jgi:hypothetical protein
MIRPSMIAAVLVGLAVLTTASPASAMYHPTMGRWAARDPIPIRAGLNLSEYAMSSPPNYMDPYGLREITITIRATGEMPRTWPSDREVEKSLQKVLDTCFKCCQDKVIAKIERTKEVVEEPEDVNSKLGLFPKPRPGSWCQGPQQSPPTEWRQQVSSHRGSAVFRPRLLKTHSLLEKSSKANTAKPGVTSSHTRPCVLACLTKAMSSGLERIHRRSIPIQPHRGTRLKSLKRCVTNSRSYYRSSVRSLRMPSKRHVLYAAGVMALILGYTGCFFAQIKVGNLNMMSSKPGTPTLGYYFSDDLGTNRACYVVYWPLAKLYELYQPTAVFLPISPFASDKQREEWDLSHEPPLGSKRPAT